MTQALAAASGLVRVTVASGARRVDLVLPGAVPVAELVPELARSVGLLDAATVYGGYRLVLPDGRRLALDSGLISQGVEDGGVLTLSAGVDEPTPRVYDDVVEAMTDVVERELRPWRPEQGRLTALVASALFLLLGAVALLVQHEARLAGVAAGVVAAMLIGGAIVLSRAERERAEDAVRALPEGSWTAVDWMDDDGVSDDPVRLQVTVTVRDGRLTVDFTGSAPATRGPVNLPLGSTIACARVAFKALTTPFEQTNAGHFAPLTVVAEPGTVFHAVYPAATFTQWTGNLAVELIYKALAQGMPERVAAYGRRQGLGGGRQEGRLLGPGEQRAAAALDVEH